MNTYNFVITNTNDESEALKHIAIDADTLEVAEDFAKQELDSFRDALVIKTEEFEQK